MAQHPGHLGRHQHHHCENLQSFRVNTFLILSCTVYRVSEGRNIVHTIKRKKANWIGHILYRNCLLKHTVEGKTEERVEVMGRQGIRRKQLPDDLTDRRWYWKLKEEALDCTFWITGFGRGYGPVVRQTAQWLNECTVSFYETENESSVSECQWV
jgi:hypothetical protein